MTARHEEMIAELMRANAALKGENARLREALELYADEDQYRYWGNEGGPYIVQDRGETARKALESTSP